MAATLPLEKVNKNTPAENDIYQGGRESDSEVLMYVVCVQSVATGFVRGRCKKQCMEIRKLEKR